MMEWLGGMKCFKAEKISPSITGITDISKTRCFLIEGEKSALLVDICIGISGLKSFVESCTGKDLTVVATHGHFDHVGGAEEFDKVYLSEKDFDIAFTTCGKDARFRYFEYMLRNDKETDIKKLPLISERSREYTK